MSYTLENQRAATEALDRGDYAEVRSRIKYLTQRHEQMVKEFRNVNNRSTESRPQESLGQQ